jgi:hypothetical protein
MIFLKKKRKHILLFTDMPIWSTIKAFRLLFEYYKNKRNFCERTVLFHDFEIHSVMASSSPKHAEKTN